MHIKMTIQPEEVQTFIDTIVEASTEDGTRLVGTTYMMDEMELASLRFGNDGTWIFEIDDLTGYGAIAFGLVKRFRDNLEEGCK
jgi:hypothetical protein